MKKQVIATFVTVKAKCKKTQKKPELKETKKVPIIRANYLFDLHFSLAQKNRLSDKK